jgi:hypothetical protein
MGTTNCLFVCHYHEPLRTSILPLCRTIRETTALDPMVAVEGDADGRMREMCKAEDVPCLKFRNGRRETKPTLHESPATITTQLEVNLRARKVRRRGLFRSLLRIVEAMISNRVKISRLGRILAKIKPAVLVMLDDRTVLACRWIRAAQRRRIPVLVMQWAAFHRASTLVALRHAQPQRERTTSAVRMLEALIAGRIHLASCEFEGERTWWIPPHNTLALWCAGAFPRTNPWAFGGGNSDITAVFGDAWKERLLQDGVAPGKLQVTGHPEQDKWYHLRHSWTARDTESVKRDLDIPGNRKIVAVIAPALHFRKPGGCRQGDSSLEEIRHDLSFVVNVVRNVGLTYVPVVKVHPRDSKEDFAYLNSNRDDPVCVTCDYPVERLVAASHAMVCQWSTTLLLGKALRVPVLVFDLHSSPSADMWKGEMGVRHAKTYEQFEMQLRACLLDEAVQQELAREGDEFVDRYLRLDGRATERLIALIGRHARLPFSLAARRTA